MVRKATYAYIQVEYSLPSPDIKITLDNSFIAAYKDRATIDVMFRVDKAARKAHAAYLDGDFHAAGRAPEIALPIVAEISNAASESEAIDIIHRFEGSGISIRMAGAWRIWSEHSAGGKEVQGVELPGFDLTNPGHVFEIHPITYVGDMGILDSFRPVEGYSPARPNDVIGKLRETRCRIVPKEDTRRVKRSRHNPEILDSSLPYEMVIIGVYKDSKKP